MACRSDHQGLSAGRPLTHSGGRPGGVATVDLRLWFELRARTLSKEMTMTEDKMALLELIEKSADADLVREMAFNQCAGQSAGWLSA